MLALFIFCCVFAGTRKGDVNNDGVIDNVDLLLLTSHLDGSSTLTAQQVVNADANSTNSLEIGDAVTIVNIYNQPAPTPSPSPTPYEITIKLPGDVPLKLVRIIKGSFTMGSNEYPKEQPPHQVTIGYNYYMGKYEVTQAQFEALMEYNPAVEYGVGPDYPVHPVTWDECQSFITKLNDYVESTAQCSGSFRLPSEAEWEYACRGKTTTRYSFGNSDCDMLTCPDCELNRYAWYCGSGGEIGAKPVGQKLPNPFGLYDMHGNIWEWCQDYWHENYTNAPTDGSAWVFPKNLERVMRSGSWNNDPYSSRSPERESRDPVMKVIDHGFRVFRAY